MFCPECGKKITSGAEFCGYCGTPTESYLDAIATDQKNIRYSIQNNLKTKPSYESKQKYPLITIFYSICSAIFIGCVIVTQTPIIWILGVIGSQVAAFFILRFLMILYSKPDE